MTNPLEIGASDYDAPDPEAVANRMTELER